MAELHPCRKAGIEVTWRCNARCIHCYYLRNRNLGKKEDKPLKSIMNEIDAAAARGCNHIYLVGQGEPTFHPELFEILAYCRSLNLPLSIITNGTGNLHVYGRLYEEGLDHLHISTHALGEDLDRILQMPGAYLRQLALKRMLHQERWPWRSNTTLQLKNYKQLNDIIAENFGTSCAHIVLLNFNPHYEWKHHVKEIAVHPVELAPYLEAALDLLAASGRFFTLRYFPFCLIKPRYWKWIVNAYYVLFDPNEWEYGNYSPDGRNIWRGARSLRKNVRIEGCEETCLAFRHCGGWNRAYHNGFGCGLVKPITEIPAEYAPVWEQEGGLHLLNPINSTSGHLRKN